MEQLKKLGFKKIPTEKGFTIWELSSKDLKPGGLTALFGKVVYTDLSKMKVDNEKKNKT